jgi:hypothetical protein
MFLLSSSPGGDEEVHFRTIAIKLISESEVLMRYNDSGDDIWQRGHEFKAYLTVGLEFIKFNKL